MSCTRYNSHTHPKVVNPDYMQTNTYTLHLHQTPGRNGTKLIAASSLSAGLSLNIHLSISPTLHPYLLGHLQAALRLHVRTGRRARPREGRPQTLHGAGGGWVDCGWCTHAHTNTHTPKRMQRNDTHTRQNDGLNDVTISVRVPVL